MVQGVLTLYYMYLIDHHLLLQGGDTLQHFPAVSDRLLRGNYHSARCTTQHENNMRWVSSCWKSPLSRHSREGGNPDK